MRILRARPSRIGVTLLGSAIAIPALLLAAPTVGRAGSADTAANTVAAETSSRRPQPEKKPLVKAQIISINDFHGHLEPGDLTISAATGTSHGRGYVRAGGASYLAAHVKQAKRANRNSVVVSAGDLIGGSPLISGRYHDEPTVEVMNRILDVGTVGNHEFDEGTTELRRIVDGGCHPVIGCEGEKTYPGAKFDVLAANVIDTATHEPLFAPTALKKVGGATIGFIGTTTTDTDRLAPRATHQDVTFANEAATIRKYAPLLREQGADVVVALTHSGATRATNGINGCAEVTGAAADLTRKVAGVADVVISAHSHNAYNCRIRGTVLTGGASYGRLFTTVQLTIDPNRHAVKAVSARNHVNDHTITPDRDVAGLVARDHRRVAPVAGRDVGRLRTSLVRNRTTGGESPLGDVVADADLAATASAGARIALVNYGYMRADLPKGRVTYDDVYTAMPFEHHTVTMTLTGSQVEKVLEEQFCAGDPADEVGGEAARDILEVSRGFSYRFDPDAPCGKRIRLGDVKLGGRALGAATRYRVTVNDFAAPGLNGLPTLAKGTDRVTGGDEADLLADYLSAHRGATLPTRTGRILTR